MRALISALLLCAVGCGVSLDPENPDGTLDTGTDSSVDTSTDTGTAAGLTGGLVELQRMQYACPSCLGKPDFELTASAAFHAPVSGTWTESFVPKGQCQINPGGGAPVTSTLDAGEWTYLEFASSAVALHRGEGSLGPTYSASGIDLDDYVSNASYDVAVSGGADLAAFEVVSAFRAAEGFSSIEPVALLNTTQDTAFEAILSTAGSTLTWAPTGTGTGMVVVIEAYDINSGNPLGRTLICHGADSGAFSVPGAQLSQLTGGSPALATVALMRRVESEGVIPTTGATLQTITMSGVSGTATIY